MHIMMGREGASARGEGEGLADRGEKVGGGGEVED